MSEEVTAEQDFDIAMEHLLQEASRRLKKAGIPKVNLSWKRGMNGPEIRCAVSFESRVVVLIFRVNEYDGRITATHLVGSEAVCGNLIHDLEPFLSKLEGSIRWVYRKHSR